MDSSTTRTDAVIRQYINQAMEARNVTQADLSKALDGRSKGYISDRVLGKRSWAISELDRISPLFGLPDALSLIAAACGSASIDGAREYDARERESQIADDLAEPRFEDLSPLDLAASRDGNRDLEAETPDE
ncbi:helix-turn-helix domain-containing protein [Bifidobacterium dentium]|uniref:helix-turn-helix domain-containing protein n=1 Tax=Bifidobacterium dentium TaxID=1689 RepID=UPI001F506A34|nr:helix-turn-helix transcriptional regulator [Bifidobacterium dentium]